MSQNPKEVPKTPLQVPKLNFMESVRETDFPRSFVTIFTLVIIQLMFQNLSIPKEIFQSSIIARAIVVLMHNHTQVSRLKGCAKNTLGEERYL